MRSGSALSFSNTFMAASAAASSSSTSALASALNDVDLDGEPNECPLCMEELDLSDLNFKPCPCGYQICRFCWHHIKQNLNGACPACRKKYDDSAVEFTPLSQDDLKKLQHTKKQRDREKKDQEINSRKHLANVRVKQKTQVHIQGLTAKLANEENIPLLKSHEWFGSHGRILKLFLARRTNMPESMMSTVDTKNQPVNVYINYASQREAAACITAVDGTITHDGTHRLRAGWGTTKYCPSFLRNQRCASDNCMMAHEQGEEIDPVGGAPGPITREEMSTLKHAMKEQESRDAQQRPSGGRGAPGLPATASWGKGNYAGPPSAPHLGPHTAFYPPISASLPPASASAPSAQRSASQSGSSTSKVSAVPSAAPAPKDPKLQRQSSQSAIGQPASKPIAARQNSVHHEEAPSAAAAAAATSAASTAEAAQQPEATSAPSTKRAADPIPPPGLPPPPPGLGGPPPPPPGLSQPLASAGPTPSTSAQTIEERDFDPGFEPFSAGTGAFTFNFNMDATQHSQEKQLPPFDLDSRPPGSTGLSDGLFSAADLLLSPPPAHPNKIYDGPDVPYTGAFNPFADASPGAEEPDARPKSSRFEFAKKGKGLFGSSDELSALGGAGVSMPPVEAPPGIAAPRGFPNGLLGQGASPSSMFTGAAPPAPGRTESPRQNVTSPPPGLKPTNGDSWTPAGLESLLTGRGTSPLSRSPRDQQHAHMPLSPFNNNNSNNSSMSIASAALPALSSAATQPLPPPSGGPSPLPPGFSHLANQPLPSALASASAYPLPPPTGNSATSGRTPNAPPGLAPPSQQPQAPQRPGSSTPTSPSANKDSNDLFGHLLSLAGSSNLIPSRSMADTAPLQDPAILNMSSAQHFAPTPGAYRPMDHFGGGGGAAPGFGYPFASQQQQQHQQARQPQQGRGQAGMAYGGLPPGP